MSQAPQDINGPYSQLDTTTLNGVQACSRFLSWLFGDDWQDVCCVASVPGTGWYGAGAKGFREHIERGDSALYYSVGVFPPGDVTPRKKERVTGVAGLVMDDVGTKGTGSALGRLEPFVGAKIETSAGNYHWVIKYAQRLSGQRELDLHVLTVNALAKLGLADRVSDITRFARLPWGKNTKPGKGDFDVRLREFTGGPGVSQTELVDIVLGLLGNSPLADRVAAQSGRTAGSWADTLWHAVREYLMSETGTRSSEVGVSAGSAASGSYAMTADLGDPDPWLKIQIEIADRLGWPAPVDGSGDGTVDCRCPFADEHSSDELIRYLGRGHWKCHHSSCQDAGRTVKEFKEKLLEIWDKEARRDGEPSGRAAIAGWAFEQAGSVGEDLLGAVLDVVVAESVGSDVGSVSGQIGVEELAARAGLVQRYALVSEGLGGQPGWWDTWGRSLLSSSQLEAREDVLEVFPAGVAGKNAARHQLANEPGIIKVDALGHEPGVTGVYVCPQTGQRKISTWKPGEVAEVAGVPSTFLEHLDYLVGKKGTRERDELEKVMAWTLREPSQKAARTVVLVGGQGVGKDLLVDCFSAMVGRQNTQHISAEQLVGSFNEWQTCRLVVLSELDAGQRYSAVNVLKRLTGSGGGYVTINEKYKRPYLARDVVQFWMTTNDLGSQPIDADSRRDLVIQCPDDPHSGGEKYYQRVAHALLEDPAEMGRIMRYLMHDVDLTGYDPNSPAPANAAKREMSRASHSDGVKEFMDALEELGLSEDGVDGLGGDVAVTSKTLINGLTHRLGMKGVSGKSRSLARAMAALGWVHVDQRVRDHNGVRTRFWVPKKYRKAARKDVLNPEATAKRQEKFRLSELTVMGVPELSE